MNLVEYLGSATTALSLGLALAFPGSACAQNVLDGFATYCTGNLDGTGQCTNQENNQRYSCLIIPGQVIDCKSKGGRPFQCVWINGIQSNQAEFWCDPTVDALLANELSSNVFRSNGKDPLIQQHADPIVGHSDDAFDQAMPSNLDSSFQQPSFR